MKKSLIILILVFILTSCHNERKLNGIWISAYEFDKEDSLKTPLTGIPFNQVVNIYNGTYKVKAFKYDRYEDTWSLKFKLRGNKLIEEGDENFIYDEINPITKDSIVITGMIDQLSRVYKRLPDSLKNISSDINLVGNKYIRFYGSRIDTINFVSDFVYISSAYSIGNSDMRWERINYNGFDILFSDGNIPYLIKKKVGNDIYVSAFDTEKRDFILKQIE